jgi:hypothetical protein
MQRASLDDVRALVAVARERSFAKAGAVGRWRSAQSERTVEGVTVGFSGGSAFLRPGDLVGLDAQ